MNEVALIAFAALNKSSWLPGVHFIFEAMNECNEIQCENY